MSLSRESSHVDALRGFLASYVKTHLCVRVTALESTGHGRVQFAEELRDLEHRLIEMASLAESMVGLAVESLKNLDSELAMEVLRRDDTIDDLDIEIEFQCLRLLALQSPTGGDLRTVGTAIKMITDIERIGDLAVDVAKAGMKIEKEFGSSDVVDVPKLANECRAMLQLAIQAFVKRDLEIVAEVITRDDKVDQMYRTYRDIIHQHMHAEPESVVSDSWLLLGIHHLERIADHAVNIAERVHFMVSGQFVQLAQSHKSPNKEASSE